MNSDRVARTVLMAAAIGSVATSARGLPARRSLHRMSPSDNAIVERLNQAELDRLNRRTATAPADPGTGMSVAGSPMDQAAEPQPPSAGFVPPAFGAQYPQTTGTNTQPGGS